MRNLISLNIFSFLPGRSWVKNGLPFIAKAPIIASISKIGDKTKIAQSERKKSSGLFMYLAYIIKPLFSFFDDSF